MDEEVEARTKNAPFWFPDTQGFLAVAIITLIALIVTILLTAPPAIDERTSGVLMTIVGVLIACLKDVYSFFFGSSKGSQAKDEVQAKVIENLTPPTGTGNGAPAAAIVAAAEAAAPAAAAEAAPPAAAEAAPPAVDAELDRRGVPDKQGATS